MAEEKHVTYRQGFDGLKKWGSERTNWGILDAIRKFWIKIVYLSQFQNSSLSQNRPFWGFCRFWQNLQKSSIFQWRRVLQLVPKMKKLTTGFSLLVLSSLSAMNRSGLEISTGPGFRQDCVDWQVFSPSSWEQYPHLRMFDWIGAIDASWVGLHAQAAMDLGWFSNQLMQKRVVEFTIPGHFEFISNGRAATCDLRLGYQIDLYKNFCVCLPFAGWFYDRLAVRRVNSLPPFFQTAEVPMPYVLANQSVVFSSKLRQKWSGPTIGAELFSHPIRPLSIDVSYGYGWLKIDHSYEEENLTQLFLAGYVPSTMLSTNIRNARIRGSAAGQIARCKIDWILSPSWFFDVDFRYFYLYSNSRSLAEVSVNGGAFQERKQKAHAQVNSASVFFDLGLRF